MIRIGILETGHNPEDLAPRFGQLSVAFRSWLDRDADGHPFTFEDYWIEDGEFPQHPETCSAYIITGSAAGVYEDHDWIEPAREFIRGAVAAERRFVGMCFGHQLLADTFGGKVEKSEKGWGIGRHTYAVHKPAIWMKPPLAEVSLLACHQDQVVSLPPGAEVLASSEFCEFAMLAIGEHVITMQAHPEFSVEFATCLYESRRHRFGEEVTDRGLESLDRPMHADTLARWVVQFLSGG